MKDASNTWVESEPEVDSFTGLASRPNRLTRYAFYGLVFSFPWEGVNIGLGESLSVAKLAGYFFFGVALLQPKITFRFPPKTFWLFLTYFFIYCAVAIYGDASYDQEIRRIVFSLIQMLVLFWLSYNVMHDERSVKGFLWALIASLVSLPIIGLFMGGVITSAGSGRLSAFGANPGTTGATLALGLIALLGLVFGRERPEKIMRLLAWLPFLIMCGFLISTGSRGGLLAFVIGMAFFLLKRGNIQTKIALGIIAILGLGTLTLLTVQFFPESLARIERTVTAGDTAGRGEIYLQGAKMVNQKPLFGWGPVRYKSELAFRLGGSRTSKDAHNLPLKILLEVGIVGAIPFFLGLGYCFLAAWKARYGLEGSLAISMLVTLLLVNMSQSWDNRKIFWIVLAYALVSGRHRFLLMNPKKV